MDPWLFWEAFKWFVPAYAANVAPQMFVKFRAHPVDFGKSWRGARVFGDHKTIEGFVLAIAFGAIFGALSGRLAFGACVGFGAILGDLIKSFFKRRVGVASGKSWFPFDQLDFVAGGLVFSLPFGFSGWAMWAAVIILSLALHLITKVVGYYLGVNDTRF